MKCPQCGFVSSNKRDLCPKCTLDLRSHKRSLGLPISYPSLSLDELRLKEGGTQATTAKSVATPQAPAALKPVAQNSAPKAPEPQAKKPSFLDRVLGGKGKAQPRTGPVTAPGQAAPVQSVSVESPATHAAPPPSAPRQPTAKAPVGEAKAAVDKSPASAHESPTKHSDERSLDVLPAVELGELEADLEVVPADPTPLHVTQALGASGQNPLSEETNENDQPMNVDFSDPLAFEKLIEQLESGENAPEAELLPPIKDSFDAPLKDNSVKFSPDEVSAIPQREDVWGIDEPEQDELGVDPQNSGPLVAPEVLEFFDDETLLEKQLDAMLEDTQLNVTAVKMERSAEPSKQALASDEASEVELDFSFEFESDEETEAEEERAPEIEEPPSETEDEADDFTLSNIANAEIQEVFVAQSETGEAVATELTALPFVDLSALLEAELPEEQQQTTSNPEAVTAEPEPEPEHPAVEQSLKLHDLISAIAEHYGVTDAEIRTRLADLEKPDLSTSHTPAVPDQPALEAIEEALPIEWSAEEEEPPSFEDPEEERESVPTPADDEIPQLVSGPTEEDTSDQKKKSAEAALEQEPPAADPIAISAPADLSSPEPVSDDVTLAPPQVVPPPAPNEVPAELWQLVEQDLLSYVAAEVEINSGDLVKREANGTLDMYFALVDEELINPAKHRSLSENIKPKEVKIDNQALKTALSTYTKKAKLVEQQVQEAAEHRPAQTGAFTIPSHLKPVPLWRRGVAAVIDCSICAGLGGIFCGIIFVPSEIRGALFSSILGGSLPELYLLLTVLPSFIGASVLAWIVLTSAAIAGKSQTFGQQYIGASVTDLRGDPVSLSDSLLWTLCQFTTLLSCGLGLLPALGKTGRTLHDRMAGVLVARFDMEEFFAAAQSAAPTAASTDEILDFRS